MPTKYNYDRYAMSEYDLGSFPGPGAGEQAEDFRLTTLDGAEARLSDYRGKWVVIETGSITCSMYVKNVGGIRRLKEKHPDVEFLLVYVREAHPGSRLKPPRDQAEKLALGRRMKEIYDDPREVLVDALDGDMHRRYGALPNMVYVVDPGGRVVYRCDWAFPKNDERVLDNRPNIDKQEHVQIITAAPWIMVPVVLRGGWDALWDLLVALPALTWAHLAADWRNLKDKIAG
jgi:hypothetical protein